MNELRVEVEAGDTCMISRRIVVFHRGGGGFVRGGCFPPQSLRRVVPSSVRFLSPELLPLIILCDMIGNAGCSPRTSSRAAAGNSRFVSSVLHP